MSWFQERQKSSQNILFLLEMWIHDHWDSHWNEFVPLDAKNNQLGADATKPTTTDEKLWKKKSSQGRNQSLRGQLRGKEN